MARLTPGATKDYGTTDKGARSGSQPSTIASLHERPDERRARCSSWSRAPEHRRGSSLTRTATISFRNPATTAAAWTLRHRESYLLRRCSRTDSCHTRFVRERILLFAGVLGVACTCGPSGEDAGGCDINWTEPDGSYYGGYGGWGGTGGYGGSLGGFGGSQTCPSDAGGEWVLTDGGCVLIGCAAGRADCDGVPGNGCETQLDSDASLAEPAVKSATNRPARSARAKAPKSSSPRATRPQ